MRALHRFVLERSLGFREKDRLEGQAWKLGDECEALVWQRGGGGGHVDGEKGMGSGPTEVANSRPCWGRGDACVSDLRNSAAQRPVRTSCLISEHVRLLHHGRGTYFGLGMEITLRTLASQPPWAGQGESSSSCPRMEPSGLNARCLSRCPWRPWASHWPCWGLS